MTDATPSPSVTRTAFADLRHEIASTRRLLERVPDEHLAWKPHDRSSSLGQLAFHLADILALQRAMIEEDSLDLLTTPRSGGEGAGREELLRAFDENAAAVEAALASLDDAALGEAWTLRRGERVILQQPRVGVLRGMGVNHLIHHRGQLTVYLRLLDVPLPPMYGPTADEAF